ncbi:MAG TPA: YceD family protein [Verrucomicrobiae bacterium]|nr:YceD family protein [Verrucomicrobiae bacterium]
MSILVNLRHLEAHPIQLSGDVTVGELDIETRDDVIQLSHPLRYDLEVQKLEDGLLVQGRLSLPLRCQCVRCLKPFEYLLELPRWTAHLPLQGEDSVPIVNDCVDLTPALREDILLELPQHPLCERECRGLRKASAGKSKTSSSLGQPNQGSPAWNELNKLKF